MKKFSVIGSLSLFCGAMLTLAGCTSDPQTAGVSTVETENALVIQVSSGDAPVKGALARVRRARYLQDSSAVDFGSNGVLAEYTTDSKGYIAIAKKDADSLGLREIAVEVVDKKQGAFGVFTLNQKAENPDSTEMSLEKFGSLKGHVENADGDSSAIVRIYGTDRYAVVDSDGNFEIEDLPPYSYILYVNSNNTDAEIKAEVVAEKTKDVGDVTLRHFIRWDDGLMISDWMKVSKAARQDGEAVVGFIRLDSALFDFSKAMEQGKDVQVVSEFEHPLTYAISYWNDTLKQAVVLVLLEPEIENVKLVWGAGVVDEKSSGLTSRAKIWESVSAEVAREQNTVRLMDFESGFKKADASSPASVKDGYFEYQGDSVSTTPALDDILDGIVKAGAGRDGYALHWTSSAPVGKWSDFGQWFSTPDKPCNMEGVDSVEYFIRGTGRYAFAFEAEDETGYVDKALYFDTLTTANADEWKRTVIRQMDFAEGTGAYANTGWEAIRTRVTNYNIDAYGDAEIWLDDITLYGVNFDDL